MKEKKNSSQAIPPTEEAACTWELYKSLSDCDGQSGPGEPFVDIGRYSFVHKLGTFCKTESNTKIMKSRSEIQVISSVNP